MDIADRIAEQFQGLRYKRHVSLDHKLKDNLKDISIMYVSHYFFSENNL